MKIKFTSLLVFFQLAIFFFLTFNVYAQETLKQVPRYTLIEGFTSCSAPICFNGHLNLQNILTQNNAQGGKYTLINYQMHWPGSGDPYYTLEGEARRNFYNVTAVPWLHVDGSGEDGLLFTNNQLVDYQNILSCIEVKGSFSVEDKTVNAIIHITPTVDINEGNNLRLFIAIVEKITHKNTCSSGQNTFVQVMKKFMPDADGIELGNLTENQTIIKGQTWEFKGDYCRPYPGYVINHDIEHSVEDFDNLEVVAWIQNIATKEIYNSCTATKETFTTFVVDYDVVGGNGSLSATVNGSPINSGDMVNIGETVDFTASPNQNYIVKEWQLNDIAVLDNTTDNYSVIVDKMINVTVEFMLESNVSTNNLATVELFPNPVTGELRILTRGHDPLSIPLGIEIFDIYGRKVEAKFPSNELEGWQPQADGVVFNISHLQAGIYFVKIITEQGEIVKKIIKQ